MRTELINKNFKYLERFRAVEFERNWNRQLNIPLPTVLSTQIFLANYNLNLEIEDKFKLNYRSTLNHRSKELSGLNNSISIGGKIKNTQIESSFERMNNSLFVGAEIQKNSSKNLI